MFVIIGLIVLLVAVTFVLTKLISAAGTHDSFAVLSQRIGGSSRRWRSHGRADRWPARGAGKAEPLQLTIRR